ncbi:translation initiation factor 3 (bIF-3) [Heliophilum fasciatum]|uniref:Translation initiation factor IF-3 n=1 Tax=Heliophilum fasciatum TaxID=35700 RepID=A0A4R2RWM0_9FIRM|nr:translation initiation factor IF-3 [Heliophilum fasciatum]TCP68860.1 translation initiation factor 3 (bIF-3) [Heliophilum fasciatum]
MGPEGDQLGIQNIREALRIAQEKNLDLVEVAPTAKPPVCRIMDYGKFKFEQSKREREARKKQKIVSIKEVKLRPNIEDHDFETKARNAIRFLEDGDKVKVTIMFRGREITHPELGRQLCVRLAEVCKPLANVERDAKVEGRNMIMILTPKSESAREAKPEKPREAKATPAKADQEAVAPTATPSAPAAGAQPIEALQNDAK